MKPEVIQSTASIYPASNVLVLGDDYFANGLGQNLWVARKTAAGQGFTLKVDTCARLIAGLQIKNTGDMRHAWATKEFQVSGSMNKSGPWETLVEDQLEDTRGGKAAQLHLGAACGGEVPQV